MIESNVEHIIALNNRVGVLENTKQQHERKHYIDIPPLDDLADGVPVVSSVRGFGIFLFVKYNNNMYRLPFIEGPPTDDDNYLVTNLTPDRELDCNASSIYALADVLGTLIQDLKTRGIING